jgi:hypothetical protein
MEIYYEDDKLFPVEVRCKRLKIEANSFMEEKVLAAIMEMFNTGIGEMTIETGTGCISWRPVKKADQIY